MTNETNLSQLIPATCHSVWETALNFIYDPTKPLTDQTVNESTVVPLYKVAHVLRIRALAASCLDWMKVNLDPASSFSILATAISFAPGLERIENICERTIARDIGYCDKDTFLGLDLATLKHILQYAASDLGTKYVVSRVAVHYIRHVEAEHQEIVFLQLVDCIHRVVAVQDTLFLFGLSITYNSEHLRLLCLEALNDATTYSCFDNVLHESDLTLIPDDTIRCALSFSKFDGSTRWVPLMQSMDVETMKEVLACCVTDFQLDAFRTSTFAMEYLRKVNCDTDAIAALEMYITQIRECDALYLLSLPAGDTYCHVQCIVYRSLTLPNRIRSMAFNVLACRFQDISESIVFSFESLNNDAVCELFDRDDLATKDEDEVFDEILKYSNSNTSMSQEQKQNLWSTCRFAWLSDDYIQRALTVKDIPKRWLELGKEERRQNRGKSPAGASLVVSEGGKTSSGGDVSLEMKRLRPRHLYGLLFVAPGTNSIQEGLEEMIAKGLKGLYLEKGTHIVTDDYVIIEQAIKIYGAGRDQTFVKGGGFAIRGTKEE